MTVYTRRRFLRSAGAATALGAAGHLLQSDPAQSAASKWQPEKGASLRLLRWKRFIQGDEEVFLANTRRFAEITGVEVTVDSENWEEVRPKAAVAANVGAGPDIIMATNEDHLQYAGQLHDVSDLVEYLGQKYGGWYDICRSYGMYDGRWIALPTGAGGGAWVCRKSMLAAAGFDALPQDFGGLLKLCQQLKARGTPPGMALGHATGDANGWTHWILWGFGGKLANEDNTVAINSKETVAALEYAKELYQTFVPGTLSWLDPSNNKAFLDGQLFLTNNGISIYYAAKNSTDAKLKEIAADMDHANMPIGPVGKPTEFQLFFNQMIFKYTKYPKAAKEYLRFMMEAEQMDPWVQASIGYVTPSLRYYEKNPIWTVDPKHTPYRNSMQNMLPSGYAGKMGYASAGALSDFIVVNMVAEAASGSKTPKEAAERAQKRAERYYKV